MRRRLVSLVLLVTALAGGAACGGDSAVVVAPDGDAGTAGGGPDGGGAVADGAPGDAAVDAPAGGCTAKAGPPGDRTVKITSGGVERDFELHVPPGHDPSKRSGLVFVFHGYTMSGSAIATASGLAKAADTRGMIVAFPNGTNGGFNAGECCGSAATSKVDDVGFARDMIAKISSEYCVDPKRVYSTGFSNGGFLSYRFACEMADTFAAVASVAGTLGLPPDTCLPKRPVPLFHVHGTGDVVVPYNGGGVGGNRSVAVSVDTFVAKNGCTGDGKIVYEKNDVSCRKWTTCKVGADVELCTVTGGGHQWPGGQQLPYGGVPSPNLDTSGAIVSFFDAHPMP